MSHYRSQRSVFPVVYIFRTGSNHPCDQLIYSFQGGWKYMASIACTLEAPEFRRRSVWQKYQQVRSTTKRSVLLENRQLQAWAIIFCVVRQTRHIFPIKNCWRAPIYLRPANEMQWIHAN